MLTKEYLQGQFFGEWVPHFRILAVEPVEHLLQELWRRTQVNVRFSTNTKSQLTSKENLVASSGKIAVCNHMNGRPFFTQVCAARYPQRLDAAPLSVMHQ